MEKINNKGERIFYNEMIKKGIKLITQPYLKEFKIRPDFYCPTNDIYYEVISTRQAYHARKDRINAAIERGLKIEIINPDGSKYFSKKPKNQRKKRIRIDFPSILYKPLAIHQCKCQKCGHSWNSRIKRLPRECPKCKNRKWERR